MKLEGMIGFERDEQSDVIQVWAEDLRGFGTSETVAIPVPIFQAILRDYEAVDEGTIRWFSHDAQMGAVRVNHFDVLIRALQSTKVQVDGSFEL